MDRRTQKIVFSIVISCLLVFLLNPIAHFRQIQKNGSYVYLLRSIFTGQRKGDQRNIYLNRATQLFNASVSTDITERSIDDRFYQGELYHFSGDIDAANETWGQIMAPRISILDKSLPLPVYGRLHLEVEMMEVVGWRVEHARIVEGDNGETYRTLYSSGVELQDDVVVPGNGRYEVRVRGRNGVPAPIEIGVQIGLEPMSVFLFEKGDDSWQELLQTVTLEAGVYKVQIVFLNDGQVDGVDRNMSIDWIEIDE